MGRPPLPPGTFGKILYRPTTSGQVQARAKFRDFDGRVRLVTKCSATRAAAERLLKAKLAIRQSPSSGGAITGATSVVDLADAWLGSSHTWSATTDHTYRSVVRNQVKPAIGQLRVQEVTPGVITRVLRAIADRSGPGAAKSAKACLWGMFAIAVEDGAAQTNPVRSSSAKLASPKSAPRALTIDQETRLVELFASSDRARALDLPDVVAWMLATGCRIGEALAARQAENRGGKQETSRRLSSAFAPAISPTHALESVGSSGHLLGTDQLGRDIMSRLIFGAREAWIVGGSVALISIVVGCFLGMIGGFYGGWIDAILSRVIDGLVAIPGLLLALVFAAIFGPGERTAIFALAIAFSPVVGRVVRGSVVAERELEYVNASRGLGNREIWTLIRHVAPNVLGALFVVATLVASRSIIVEASLSYLGVGTQPPTPSWGLMIKDGQDLYLINSSVLLVPAITLSVTVIAMNVLSDALSDRLDPAGRASGRRPAE